MVVAKYGGQICGFLQLLKNKGNIIIDLIGVKKDFQGKGIGKSMINYALRKCASKETSFFVGTQLRNLKSIHFIIILDFISQILNIHSIITANV